jgi:integrase/recombinase XerD
MDLDDPGNLGRRLNRQLKRLDKAVKRHETVADSERQAIRGFLAALQADRDNTPQSNANHVKLLRLTAERTDTNLLEFDKDRLDRFTVTLLQDYDLKKKTVNNYKGSWKPFFGHLGRDWADNIEFYNLDNDDVEAWRVFSDEEVDAMLEAADGRTTCAIAILADTGLRITMLLSIPVGGKDFTGKVPVLKLNKDAPTKDAEGNIPLTFSRTYIANYLSGDHPRPSRDDVALIHKSQRFDEDGDGALSPKTLRGDIKDVMERVGIEKRRRKVHNFRHTAVTNWLRMNMPEQILQHRTKWSDMSMQDRYGHLIDEDKDEMTAEFFGLISPEDSESGSVPEDAVGECPTCTASVRPDARYCPGCGTPLDAVAAHDVPPDGLQKPEETAEDLADFDDVLDEMGTGAVLEQLLRNNPDLLDDLDLG